MGSLIFKAHSHGIYFVFKNRRVIVFLCPHKTLPKSSTPSVTPSTVISGIVKLLISYTLYLAPFLTSKAIEDFNFPNLLFFLVARVTTTLTSSPGASFDLSGVILYSLFLIGFRSNTISISWSPTFLNFNCFLCVLPTITFPKSQTQVVKYIFSNSLVSVLLAGGFSGFW